MHALFNCTNHTTTERKKKKKEKKRRMAKTWTVDMDPRCRKPLAEFHVKAHHLGG